MVHATMGADSRLSNDNAVHGAAEIWTELDTNWQGIGDNPARYYQQQLFIYEVMLQAK